MPQVFKCTHILYTLVLPSWVYFESLCHHVNIDLHISTQGSNRLRDRLSLQNTNKWNAWGEWVNVVIIEGWVWLWTRTLTVRLLNQNDSFKQGKHLKPPFESIFSWPLLWAHFMSFLFFFLLFFGFKTHFQFIASQFGSYRYALMFYYLLIFDHLYIFLSVLMANYLLN